MNNTLAMLTRITNNYDVQAAALTDLQEGQRGMEQRLQALEKQPPTASVPASTVGDDDPPSSWADGTLTSWRQTLKAAKDILRQLDVPLTTTMTCSFRG